MPAPDADQTIPGELNAIHRRLDLGDARAQRIEENSQAANDRMERIEENSQAANDRMARIEQQLGLNTTLTREVQSAIDERAKKYDAFIDLLIDKEQGKAAMRKAVIEKSLTALIGTVFTAMGLLLWEGFKSWMKQNGK